MFRLLASAVSVAALLIFLSIKTPAHPSWGIVVDNQGQVYVSDLETIWKIDAQGRRSVFRQRIGGRHTHELTIDEAGNLYGEDLSYEPSTQRYTSAIWKMTPAGGFSYVLAPTTNPPKGLSIWKDRDGNTYLAQAKNNSASQIFLLKRTSEGDVTTIIGSRADGEGFRQIVPYSIGGMAFGTDGSLYLTDRISAWKVTMAGEVNTLARNIPTESLSHQNSQTSRTSLMGLTVDAAGNVYAADFGNRRVLKIAPGGEVKTLLRGEEGWSPSGVAFKNGDLYVLEFEMEAKGARVRKLSADGKVSGLAIIGADSNSPDSQQRDEENAEGTALPRRITPYALFGLGAGVLALTLVFWRARRKNGSRRAA